MTLRAVHATGDRRRWPLSERIVDENLGGYHRVPQPCALGEQGPGDDQVTRTPARAAEQVDQQHDGGEQEFADVEWLFAWTDEVRRERRRIKRRRPDRGSVSHLRRG
jgi:hypothetical protein